MVKCHSVDRLEVVAELRKSRSRCRCCAVGPNTDSVIYRVERKRHAVFGKRPVSVPYSKDVLFAYDNALVACNSANIVNIIRLALITTFEDERITLASGYRCA